MKTKLFLSLGAAAFALFAFVIPPVPKYVPTPAAGWEKVLALGINRIDNYVSIRQLNNGVKPEDRGEYLPQNRADALEMCLLARGTASDVRQECGDALDIRKNAWLVLKSDVYSEILYNWALPHIRGGWNRAHPEVRMWHYDGLKRAAQYLKTYTPKSPAPIDEAVRTEKWTDYTLMEAWLWRRLNDGVPKATLEKYVTRALTDFKLPDGAFTGKFPNGKTAQTGVVIGMAPDGPWKTYHPNGKVAAEMNFSKGVRNGKFTEYTENGVKILEMQYVLGKPSGDAKEYFDNGNIKFEVKYQNAETFVRTEYYENGKKKEEEGKKNGKDHGWNRMWDERGKLVFEREYADGNPVGKGVNCLGGGCKEEYFENGTFKSERQYSRPGRLYKTVVKESETKWVVTYYYENGKPYSTEEQTAYYDSKPKNLTFYYSDGTPVKSKVETRPEQPNVRYKYNEDGSVKEEKWVENGQRNGPERSYSFRGLTLSDYNYKNGSNHGLSRLFICVSTGEEKPMLEGVYENGQRHGVWKEYIYTEGDRKLIEIKITTYENGKTVKEETQKP